MKTLALSILAVMYCGQAAASQMECKYDDVIWDDQVTTEATDAGFGLIKTLDVIADEKVNPLYEALRKRGRLSVSVQKLPAKGERYSAINQYTFTSTIGGGWMGGKPETIGTLVVNTYLDLAFADDSPTVVEVVKSSK